MFRQGWTRSLPDADQGGIGLWHATLLVTGSIVGSGVYLLPASMAPYGAASLLGWGGAIVLSLLFAFVFARLAVLPDDRGSGFVDRIAEAFGPFAAYLAAALYWAQAALGNVALALAVAGCVLAVAPSHPMGVAGTTALTMVILWFLTGIAMCGPRVVAALEGWMLVLGLVPILGLGVLGWWWFDPVLFGTAWTESVAPLTVTVPQTTLLALWAFLGLESASLAAGMVGDPRRVIPRATMAGILLASLIYVPACMVFYGLVSPSALAGSTAPFADVASRLLGSGIGTAIAASAACKAAGTLAGWVLLTAEAGRMSLRLLRGAAAEGSAMSGRQILANCGLQSLVILAVTNPSLARQFTVVVNGAVIVMLCVYAMAAAALVRLQYRASAGWLHPAIGCAAIAMLAAATVGALQDTRTQLVLVAFVIIATVCWMAARRSLAAPHYL